MREAVWWVLATAVGLLVFEGVGRLLHVPTRYFVIPMQSNCLQRSASLGTEFRPNCAATWTAFILTGSQATTFRTNSLGLRDSEIDDDGAERILAIGDSCTWGWQVAQDEAYPQVLQRLLESRFGPGRYRVINAGTPGYTSHQGLVYLRERGLALHPAVVIFGYAFNDANRSGDIEEALALQRRTMPFVKLDDQLMRYSALWRDMRSVTSRAPANAALRVPPDRFRFNLTEIVRLTHEHGAKPLMLDFSGDDTNDPYTGAMGELAEALGVPMVIYAGPRIDIVHPTREGHAQLAETVVERLVIDRYIGARSVAE